ncbi:hypothetical protein GCM10022389_26780 [Flavobacterium cheonanense]|uniref:Uncharacterized protein n=1 Tax=Flavobacterium cheonanense TaxID=706183 RepID=A0ABP7W250_9FLAO
MKIYYYLLFRIYMFYAIREKHNNILSTSFLSTLLISLNLIAVFLTLNYLGLVQIVNPIIIASSMVILWVLNYYLIIQKKAFLNQDFKEDKNGGILVCCYILFSFLLVFIVAKLNRERIFNV